MTAHSEITGSDQGLRPETWTPLPAPFSKYEVSNSGYGPDQKPVRRIGGAPLAVSVSNSGYPRVKPYDDNGKQQTVTVHSLVLLGFDGPCPPGMESRHLDDDSFNNRWAPGVTKEERMAAGGNLMYGFKWQNVQDTFDNGRPRAEVKPDKHCIVCGLVFTAKGRRCEPCRAAIGKRAAAMLRAGMNLDVVTLRAGYRKPAWVHEMAVQFGGYEGTLEQAEAQGRTWPRRAAASLRYVLRWR